MISDKCEYCLRRVRTVQWTEKFGRLCDKCSKKYTAGDLNDKFAKKAEPEWRRMLNKRRMMINQYL